MQEDDRKRGEVIRAAREAKQWTQAHLAEAAGVSTRTIMRVERDEDTSAETLLSLCAALDIPASALPRPTRGPGSAPEGYDAPAAPAEEPQVNPAESPAPSPLPSQDRWAGGIRRTLVVSSAVISLTVIGATVGLHLAWMAVSPHREKAADAFQAVFATIRTKQINLLSVRYSTLVPADAPERKWEVWKEPTTVSWSSCGRDGDGLLFAYGRLALTTRGEPSGCKEMHFDLKVVRRDDALTEVVVGPTTPTYLRGMLASLTGDPSVRFQAMSVDKTYDLPDTGDWVDARIGQVAIPDGGTSYARIRISGIR